MEIKENQYHIVLFPWLAFGHIIPYSVVSMLLQRLITTTNSSTSSINFISIDFPSVENLPAGCEATYLKKAYDELQAPVKTLLHKIKPDLIIFDLINCWIPDVGAKLGIPTAFFSVYSTPMLAFAGPPSGYKESTSIRRLTPEDFMQVSEWIPFPSTVSYLFHEAVIIVEENKIKMI
ncbi:hypothetical protein MKX01_020576 [Papaver californicum]|nr:hypothetical protein MKX01_020576 [Papaver californicum]